MSTVNHDPAIQWVFPGDDVETVIDRVCTAGVSSVQLLVPEGVTLLYTDATYETLRRTLAARHVDLLIISSDEKALATAKKFHFETILVKGTAIVLPPHSTPRPSSARAAASVPTREPVRPPPPSREAADDFDPFAELDSLSEVFAEADGKGEQGTSRPEVAADARPRIRPEDVVLSEEEVRQAASILSGGGRSRVAKKKAPPKKLVRGPTEHGVSAAEKSIQEHRLTIALPFPPRSFILALLILLVLFGIVMFWLGRVTVSVALPPRTSQMLRFTNQPVMIVQSQEEESKGSRGSRIGVRAEVISAHHEVSRTGHVEQQTRSPGTPARGMITLLNESGQSIFLPAGTEFIGTNRLGQTVRFTSDTSVVIPGVSSVRQGIQIITTLGSAQIPITARVAGQRSNIEANTITHMVIPGQSPVSITAGPLFVEHGPIGGGEETLIRIVKREDVYPVLGAALTDLYHQALDQMQTVASKRGLVLNPEMVFPGPDDLANEPGVGYEAIIAPPIGQVLEGTDTFLVRVRADFRALATPVDVPPVAEQVRAVLPSQLVASGVVSPGLAFEPVIEQCHWDGSQLTVSGAVKPAHVGEGLDAQTIRAIRQAIKGKTYRAAMDELERLKQQGVISNYVLPPRGEQERFPEWDLQIVIEVLPHHRLHTYEPT